MKKLTKILSLVALLSFASCGAAGNFNPLSLLTGNNWVLSTLMGKSLDGNLFSSGLPFLNFMDEGRLAGFTGCNNFNGSFNLESAGISLDPGAMTRKACPGNGEDQFIDALKKVNNYKVSKNKLTLLDKGSEIMSLVPQR
ncbi:META domain-containing protein [Arthrospiribacter ruber]|uniref:META domain-containing protein n=1 Tax=Arthrospiribacter ruber TaxID=2487934 RepID=A0A951IYS3_9BACT|nr:META domain-containing protein [Arthrospiribacter ruber]MBW3468907.1 META domain-containing protein [Arthrospiribacter ruber]